MTKTIENKGTGTNYTLLFISIRCLSTYLSPEEKEHSKSQSYTYDYENRLIKVATRHEDKAIVVSFKYDPFGRRIEKRVEEIENGKIEEAKSYTYVYDNEDIILEYFAKAEDRKVKTEVTKYVHGPGIDEPLSIQRKGEIYYYLADGLGSIVALTDNRQKMVESFIYDSFGNLKMHGDKVKNAFTYTGREWDKETGLYYYRARYYDPMEGRFISRDPIGFKGGINLYAYVSNNVVNDTDPMGLYPGLCGNESHQWVPDKPWLFCDFSGPCQGHDDCYGCAGKLQGKTKSQCDREFLNGMLETCKKLHGEAYATCVGAAFVYYNAVSWGGGEDFDNARKCCQ